MMVFALKTNISVGTKILRQLASENPVCSVQMLNSQCELADCKPRGTENPHKRALRK